MDSADANILVQSKENIQPLRGGRNIPQLYAALQAETSQSIQLELKKQKEYYETQLRSYKGDDPLCVWDEYIGWWEQSFPRQGQKSKFHNLLKKCINKFKDQEKYMNDARFVKLCIRYAELEDNTFEVLRQIGKHGIGNKSAYLYIALADLLTNDKLFKKANLIYQRAKAEMVQPMELLEQAHMQFELYVGRQYLTNSTDTFSTQQGIDENGCGQVRQPWNALRSIKTDSKEIVPSVRIGDNVTGTAGKLQQSNIPEDKTKKNKAMLIYHDEDDENDAGGVQKMDKFYSKKVTSKENLIKKSGKINKLRAATVGVGVPASKVTSFPVHSDGASEVPADDKPQAVLTSVLKTRKTNDEPGAETGLLAEKPTDKLMFAVEQVYAGDQEFQFEELRAIIYRLKREEMKQKMCSDVQAKVKKHRSDSRERKPYSRQTICENVKKTVNPAPPAGRKTFGGDLRPFTREDSTFDQSDFTIHTKEAMNEIQNFWGPEQSPCDVVQPVKPEVIRKSTFKPAEEPQIQVFVDESCMANSPVKPDPRRESILRHTTCTTDEPKIQVFVDESCIVNSPVRHPSRRQSQWFTPQVPSCSKENVVIPFVKGPDLLEDLEPENKENYTPSTAGYPVGKSTRPVTGVLTLSDNVPFQPVSEGQESEDDKDDDVDERDGEAVAGVEPLDRTCTTETWNYTARFKSPSYHSTPTVTLKKQMRSDCDETLFVSERDKKEPALDQIEDKMSQLTTSTKLEEQAHSEYQIRHNLSTIVETSRENYKSSSSSATFGRQSVFGLSKSTAITPHTSKSVSELLKVTSTPGSALCPPRLASTQNLTGYEASSEMSYKMSTYGRSINETGSGKKFNRLANLQETIEEEIDPFDTTLINNLLNQMCFPQKRHVKGYNRLDTNLPPMNIGSALVLGKKNLNIRTKLGEGSYAKVYKASSSSCGEIVVKVQKPAWAWEFFISREIQLRLADKNMAAAFVNIDEAYIYNNGSLLAMPSVEYGDLLTVMNYFKVKEGKPLLPGIVVSFTIEILNILDHLHGCKIIHGDIKPDNFVICNLFGRPNLQLIDFGRSIDMTLFPDGTSFKRVVTTEGFTCVEMQTGKSWTYQTDLYGAANTAHCMLFGEYMQLKEKDGAWDITKVLPRYWPKEEWKQFFSTMLNVESCEVMPDLKILQDLFQNYLSTVNIEAQFTRLNNILKKR